MRSAAYDYGARLACKKREKLPSKDELYPHVTCRGDSWRRSFFFGFSWRPANPLRGTVPKTTTTSRDHGGDDKRKTHAHGCAIYAKPRETVVWVRGEEILIASRSSLEVTRSLQFCRNLVVSGQTRRNVTAATAPRTTSRRRIVDARVRAGTRVRADSPELDQESKMSKKLFFFFLLSGPS